MNKLLSFFRRFAPRIMTISSSPSVSGYLTELELRNLSYADLLSYTIRNACRTDSSSLKRPMEKATIMDKKKKKKKPKREFDMSKYGQRLIALRMAYAGWNFHGFASQADIENTVENRLFEAMLKTRLVESRETCEYSRAGRTDVGVSALGQVIGIRVRSNVVAPSTGEREMDYVKVINSSLPKGIRVLAWAPVCEGSARFPKVYEGDPEEIRQYWNEAENGGKVFEWGSVRRPGEAFSARFDAVHRSYKYFFLSGGLNVGDMQKAASSFAGRHDFRNFCRIDENVTNFERLMYDVEIRRAEDDRVAKEEGEEGGEHVMYYIFVKGQAFLWHQVRCMAAVLFDVGMGKEKPDIVRRMLDYAKNEKGKFAHGRPQYRMASPTPLLLYECVYPDAVLSFSYSCGKGDMSKQEIEAGETVSWHTSFERADADIAVLYAEQATKAAVLGAMLRDNDKCEIVTVDGNGRVVIDNENSKRFQSVRGGRNFLLNVNKGNHVPYDLRACDDSVEMKLERAAEKSKAKKLVG